MNTLVLESTEQGDMAVDVYQKLAGNRILFISSEIDDKLAADISATLLLKDTENSQVKITLFINSSGGNIRNVLMIYDMMQMIEAPIETICIGAAMDEAAMLLAAGEPGMRFATKNAQISVSQLINDSWAPSNLTDAKKYLDLSVSDNKRMMDILSKCSGKTTKEVMTDFDRRVFMSASQALHYGLIDKVIPSNK